MHNLFKPGICLNPPLMAQWEFIALIVTWSFVLLVAILALISYT